MIEVSIDDLRKRKLMVVTPMFGGQCYGGYAMSMVNLAIACTRMGIHLDIYTITNESLITRARSYGVEHFLASDCTHMLFIDADITFPYQAVIDLLAYMGDDYPADVMAVPYPKKTIAWEKVVSAVDAGKADEDPSNLSKFVGDFVFNLVDGQTTIDLTKPFEVSEAGTGFMMMKRSVLEKFREEYPELKFTPDHVRDAVFDGSKQMTMFFDTVIDPVSNRYLSEDYMFCNYVRRMGGRVEMIAWHELKHTGTYVFGGTIMNLAAIKASPTADRKTLKKK